MRITVQADPEHEQIYILLHTKALQAGAVRRTRRIDENIALDYDVRGKLVGIDVMNVSTPVSHTDSPA
jgi:uncharacterized protein YuzE